VLTAYPTVDDRSWGITEQAFATLLQVYEIERVTAGHLRLRGRLFEGLEPLPSPGSPAGG
jgi:hypothetical protein